MGYFVLKVIRFSDRLTFAYLECLSLVKAVSGCSFKGCGQAVWRERKPEQRLIYGPEWQLL